MARMYLVELLDIEKLKAEIRGGTISVRTHPLDPTLAIFNYTHAAAFEGEWTHEQKVCRGLIVQNDLDGGLHRVVARPFPKFFNYGEHLLGHEDIPLDEPFTVTTKEDGSLGILYQAPDGPAIATRGSFESDQATWATEWLRGSVLPSGAAGGNVTRLFEIIYPANRIVLDYGDFEGLIHLATLDTETGRPVPENWWTGLRAQTHKFGRLEDLLTFVEEADSENQEGFVIYFPESDLRVKVKFEEYVKLHRILTGLSERRIWEHISEGGSIEDFIEGVPDEFFDWVREVDARLRREHAEVMADLRECAGKLHAAGFETKKDLAIFINGLDATASQRGKLFAAYDGQWDRISTHVWRDIRPAGNVTFRDDDDS